MDRIRSTARSLSLGGIEKYNGHSQRKFLVQHQVLVTENNAKCNTSIPIGYVLSEWTLNPFSKFLSRKHEQPEKPSGSLKSLLSSLFPFVIPPSSVPFGLNFFAVVCYTLRNRLLDPMQPCQNRSQFKSAFPGSFDISQFVNLNGTSIILDQGFVGYLDVWLQLELGTQNCTTLFRFPSTLSLYFSHTPINPSSSFSPILNRYQTPLPFLATDRLTQNRSAHGTQVHVDITRMTGELRS